MFVISVGELTMVPKKELLENSGNVGYGAFRDFYGQTGQGLDRRV